MTAHRPSLKLMAFLVATVACVPVAPAHAGSVGQFIADASTTTKIKAALLVDSRQVATSKFRILRIKVETINGDVILSGIVDTPRQEFAAIQIATLINGVVQVTDDLSVTSLQIH